MVHFEMSEFVSNYECQFVVSERSCELGRDPYNSVCRIGLSVKAVTVREQLQLLNPEVGT